MMQMISRAALAYLRETYKPGVRVRLVQMNDPYTKLKPGDTGTVIHVDDAGTVHIHWDIGSTLGVAYGEDYCEVVKNKSEDEEVRL